MHFVRVPGYTAYAGIMEARFVQTCIRDLRRMHGHAHSEAGCKRKCLALRNMEDKSQVVRLEGMSCPRPERNGVRNTFLSARGPLHVAAY